MDKIAVLIPCYNESQTIEKVVNDYKVALPEASIYVYDNNSTDGTAEIAERAGAIVRHEPRQGKGNVIRSMFRDIEADCYMMVDGDDAFPADNARDLCDFVLNQGVDRSSATGCRLPISQRISADSTAWAISWCVSLSISCFTAIFMTSSPVSVS